jgi:hypothetical protein
MEDAIMKYFEVNNIQINKYRGQGYDGANVMSGVYNGLQKQICEREPNAICGHCAANNLNLVLKDAVCVQPVQIFFDNIQQFYTLFSSRIKRGDFLLNINLIKFKFEVIMMKNPENDFKINVFYTNIDITISQLHTHFIGMNNIVNMFKFIFPKNLALYSDTELTQFAKMLVEQYLKDLSISAIKFVYSTYFYSEG